MYVCVRAHTCAFVHVRLRPCPYVCVRALASAFVRVRASAFVCVHIIKNPDAAARIIGDASGRVFCSRTFEMDYSYCCVVAIVCNNNNNNNNNTNVLCVRFMYFV